MTARWQTGTVACGGEEIYYEVRPRLFLGCWPRGEAVLPSTGW